MVKRKRLKRIPKPRRHDNVEMVDLSRTFGRVTKIVSPTKVEVEWSDKTKPERKIERIKDLALTRRIR